ncbi:MAG: Ig-like domain-containing protein, partial [Actinomycetota bacterium]|nr:Ig-like domain-containing protein [Actinomycetota bacterium]
GNMTYTPAVNANGSATVSVKAVDDGGTDNGGVNESAIQTFKITVTAVNDVPSFTKGSDQTVNEDAGAKSISNWATAISKGPADESAQTLTFTVTSNSNPGLFSAAPDVSSVGTLTYTSAANLYGTATIQVRLSDNGGTDNGGSDTSPTQSFTITVGAVNDAPTAVAKSFDVQANMKISLDGLLVGAADASDVAGDATWSPTFTLGSVTADAGSGCAGCTVSNVDKAAGSFDFEPPAGGTGTYTATYTVVDTGHPAPGVVSAPQTITFTVNGPVVWFVDSSSGNDSTGNGTLARPFATLGKAATVDASNHRVFLHPGIYADGITLTSGEWLTGAGTKALSFDSLMGISPPDGTIARPAINGTNPTVQGGVVLGSGNTVRGLTLTGSPALSGTSFGTLSTGAGSSTDVGLNSAGQALSLTTGTISGDFSGTSSNSGTNNVLLSSVGTSGTSLGGGALSGASAEGFRVVGGSGTFSYSGTVSNAGGATVSIANKTGGTVTLSGAVSDTTGAGVALSNNTGATITFSGGVTVTSGTSPAFAATGGGTVNVTGTDNTLTSTTGTALNVANTTIGSSGLVFRSISANGAANGIVLNATGSSGALSVTGTGTTAGSGGTIQNTTGDGVSLTSTRDVSLANVSVANTGRHGILGSGVTNLTLTRVQVTGAGDADNERGVFLTNQAGTLAISGGTYSDASDDLVHVDNTNTNLTATINNGAAFQNLTTTFANNALQFVPNGTSAINATVTNATFTNIKNSSVHVGAATFGSNGSSSLTFSNNSVTSDVSSAGGIAVSGQESTTTVLTVTGNTFSSAGGNGVVNTDANDNSTLFATLTNNTFTSPKGHAIVSAVDEAADTRVRIESNTISNAGGDGIQLTNFGDDSAPVTTSTAHFIVRNNAINGHSANSAVRFVGAIGIFNFEGDGDTTCAAVTGNTVTGTPATYFDIYLQDMAATPGNFTFEETDNYGTGQVTEAYLKLKNPATTQANDVSSGPVYSNGATCLAP